MTIERPETFGRTLRSLAADRGRGSVLLAALSFALLALCVGWLLGARIGIHLSTPDARLEVERGARVLAAPVAGRIAELRVYPGQRVERGDLLFQLDGRLEGRQVAEVERRIAGLGRQLVAAEAGLRSAADRLDDLDGLVASRRAESAARARAAEAAATAARLEADRAQRMLELQLLSRAEHDRLAAEADRLAAEAEAARRSIDRLTQEAAAERQQLISAVAAHQGELSELSTDLAAAEEELAARRVEADRHRVRAPAAGRIAALGVRHRGAVVAVGDPLATLVPDQAVGAVAFFPAGAAFGRVRPGQSAELRLDAFPWTEYGSLRARVVAVEEASHAERIRVELELLPGGGYRGSRSHGLAATAVIEVERRSPLQLLVRGLSRPLLSEDPTGAG